MSDPRCPLGLIVVLCIVLVVPMMAMGKSPHVRYDPSEISTTLDDVVGLGPVKDEVVKSLNLFLGYQTFREVMGGNPRKGVLFEGPPGTGKTYMAKAMAHEAGVPFLFVSSTAFQSQYYGATGRKIRNYFKELRKAAAEEGGAIGFIEEIDAIAGARSGMRAAPLRDGRDLRAARTRTAARVERNTSEGISGVVNELLDPDAVVRLADRRPQVRGLVDRQREPAPAGAPAHLEARRPKPSNILLIAATNRAADLDPALLRPGRFDRSIHFDLPSRSGRREIIDYYLDRKAHVPELDKEERRDALAAMTFGYTPVMIEHLFDEGLVWALRDGQIAMNWVARAAGEDDRGDRAEAAGRVHRRRAAHDRDPRSGSRDGRVPRRVRTASSRCCRSSSAATRSVCSRTATARSGSPARAPSCSG